MIICHDYAELQIVQVSPEESGSAKNSGSSHKTSYSKTSSVSSSQVKRTSSESSGADDVIALIRNELNQVDNQGDYLLPW